MDMTKRRRIRPRTALQLLLREPGDRDWIRQLAQRRGMTMTSLILRLLADEARRAATP